MKRFNALYSYGLNTKCSNKAVRVFSTLKNNTIKNHAYLDIYGKLNLKLNSKTARTK